ncbi:hypothetical protein HII13_001188 [Brettanomyces bruxellensis]|nr:hypothetical protein HII12_005293 [Brettanomyces bruxellensis]KAF6013939.1 hypothetical protein HII13_001188 [Brettanomyces bruxellensis]
MATKLHTDISMIQINGKDETSSKQTNSEQPRIIPPSDITTALASSSEQEKSGKGSIEKKGTSLKESSTNGPGQHVEGNNLKSASNNKVNEDRKPHLSNLITEQRPSVSSRSSSYSGNSSLHSGGSVLSQNHLSRPKNETKTIPPRKRSKVSRACDQCRRKKIRCNAVLNMTNNQLLKTCSNCQKNGDMCTFTRIPLKRGPNKGYTKSRKRKSASTGSHSPMSQKSSGLSYTTFSAPEAALDGRNTILGNAQTLLPQQLPSQQPQGPLSLEGFKSAQQILLPPVSYPSFPDSGFSSVPSQPQLISQSQQQRQQFQFQSPPSQSSSQFRVQGHSRSQSLSQYGVTQPQQLSQVQPQLQAQAQAQIQPQIQPQSQTQTQGQQQQQQQQHGSPLLPNASSFLQQSRVKSTGLSAASSTGPAILPPLARSRSMSINSQGSQSGAQAQQLFWKVPYDVPPFTPPRKGSIDSVNSSAATGFSFGLRGSSFSRTPPAGSPRFPLAGSSLGASDSTNGLTSETEEDFFRGRISRVVSPAPSITGGRAANMTLDPKQPQQSGLPIQQQNQKMQQSVGKPQYDAFYSALQANLNAFYDKLQVKYPVLPQRDILVNCIQQLNGEEYIQVLEILGQALQILNSLEFSSGFVEAMVTLENTIKLVATKSSIRENKSARIIFTTTMVLLNYIVILSGNEFSIGFGVAFSVFKDWRLSTEDFTSTDFHNLMHLMILDNCYSLYFGTPRSSTLYYSLDETFIKGFIQSFESTVIQGSADQSSPKVDMEYFKIGMELILMSNNMQKRNDMKNIEKSLKLPNSEYKFLNILKYSSELTVYIGKLTPKISTINNTQIEDFIFETEYDIYKYSKKVINLIDEQFDDFEIFKLQPLLSLIVLKCMKILKSLRVIICSILDMDSIVGRENFGKKLHKLVESVDNNISRCTNLRLSNQLVKTSLFKIANSKYDGIRLVKTRTNNTVDELSVFKNWCRLTNTYITSTLENESINGWK